MKKRCLRKKNASQQTLKKGHSQKRHTGLYNTETGGSSELQRERKQWEVESKGFTDVMSNNSWIHFCCFFVCFNYTAEI